MRAIIVLLPVILMAQTPAQTPPPLKPAATAKPAATPGAISAGTAKPPAAAKPAAAKPVAKPTGPLATDEEKTIYAVGLSMYRQLAQLEPTPAELEIIKRALGDAAVNKPAIELTEW